MNISLAALERCPFLLTVGSGTCLQHPDLCHSPGTRGWSYPATSGARPGQEEMGWWENRVSKYCWQVLWPSSGLARIRWRQDWSMAGTGMQSKGKVGKSKRKMDLFSCLSEAGPAWPSRGLPCLSYRALGAPWGRPGSVGASHCLRSQLFSLPKGPLSFFFSIFLNFQNWLSKPPQEALTTGRRSTFCFSVSPVLIKVLVCSLRT